MSFRSWFSGNKRLELSKRSPVVKSLIRKTVAYLRKRAAEDPRAQIRPAMLAQAIGENEMVALTALDMLQNAGVTKAYIGLYCDATMHPLAKVEPGRPLPESMHCDACSGEPHDLDTGTMRREIFFTFDPEALAGLKEAA
jgi:hypothetical protein